MTTPPSTFMRALELKGTLRGQKPDLKPPYNDEFDYVGLLGLGNQLGLWKYLISQPGKLGDDGKTTPKVYVVEINGRIRNLFEWEVPGWVLGILDATTLEVGPFAYREGLE